MALHSYLAEEIALDHADGHLSRREALRRLGLLGLSATAAASLLAACGDGGEGASATTTSAGPTASSGAPRATVGGGTVPQQGLPTERITYAGRSGQVQAAFAAASGTAKGAVLVVHENRGLTDHIAAVAGRLAAQGYTALAPDLTSPEGGRGTLDDARAMAALSGAPRERLVGDLQAGLEELARRAPGRKLGAVGFCFGGGMVWSLVTSPAGAQLAAAVPFYGPFPDGGQVTSKAAVLGVYAEQDARVNASRPAAEAALKAAGVVHEVRTFGGADHAFFNDTGPRYNPVAAADANEAMLAWFREHLA